MMTDKVPAMFVIGLEARFSLHQVKLPMPFLLPSIFLYPQHRDAFLCLKFPLPRK